jgi:TM2 domain-containing membrane protein YozV
VNDDPRHDPNVGERPHWGGGGTGTGSDAAGAPPSEEKSAVLAAVLGFLPGVGHLYLGAVRRGAAFAGAFLLLIFSLNTYAFRPVFPLLSLGITFLVVYSVVDAARGARAINTARRLGRPAPRFGVPWVDDGSTGDGRLSGWVLIAVGVLLLGVTRFDLNLRWIVEWWPAILIVLGARMIGRNRQD